MAHSEARRLLPLPGPLGLSGRMDMGGMSMGVNMFQTTNIAFAHDYWYIIAGVLGMLGMFRLVNLYQAHTRLKAKASNRVPAPTKPSNFFLGIWATLTAIVREASYPQLHIPVRWLEWMEPPPMGRVIVLLCYWAVIIYMATWQVTVWDANYWERIGFRNAWVTVMQVPLLYLLASKCSILGIFAGMSYERFNWLHRWVGRTMLVTASVHGWHFFREYQLAGLVTMEIQAMPMIKYGLGAWGLLLWTLVASFAPLRRLSYELFVTQHVLTSVLFLWVVYVHVPTYAQYNVWFAIAALCFDRVYRTVLLIWNNVKLTPNKSNCQGGQYIGHEARVQAMGDSTTVVTVKDVHFKWRAGQHLYLWIPRIGLTETHPYTIACAHKVKETCVCNSVQLVVRKHSGFSSRLHSFARKAVASGTRSSVTAFLSGPYGSPPRWDIYETLILISASTGASFTLPILESIIQYTKTNCTKRVDFLLASKRGEDVEFYVSRLHTLVDRARAVGLDLRVLVALTGDKSSVAVEARSDTADSGASEKQTGGTATVDLERGESRPYGPRKRFSDGSASFGGSVEEQGGVQRTSQRPDIEAYIRGPVEATCGETGVVVCGGNSLVARVRNCVTSLSDERAVHKGTGAQGIALHVEEYCF